MMTRLTTRRLGLMIAGLAGSAIALVAGQQQPSGAPVYTAAQAAAGRATYQANCASCHVADLGGRNEAPQLAGGDFMNTWRSRTTKDLLDYMSSTMPPGGPSLSPDQYAGIVAYILQQNSAAAGTTAFNAATAVPIGSIATGQRPTAAQLAAQGGAGAGGGRGRGGGRAGGGGGRGAARVAQPRGVTVAGEVKNYVPVTDDMLKNPPAGDWLMARRVYQGTSYSPLNEITAANVKDLRLAWVWNMNESGANQTMPLVHNGIMYLWNTGNMIQALDAKTGELIWENEVGPLENIGFGSMRNIAIYQDKIVAATTDARIVTLSAINGKKIWETAIADRTKGYSNTSGPIVAKGKVIQGLQGCTRYGPDRCFISAYDVNTGQQVWKFNTIAHTGEPGGDTWGKLGDNFRQGGETWIAGSYDPDLNLTYWGIAQAKPWMPASRGTSVFDKGLYSASTVALNVDDGKLAWHFQHVPGESLDLDEVFERVLVDNGPEQVRVLDRKVGHPLETRSAERQVPRRERDGLSERLRPHRSPDGSHHLPQRHRRAEGAGVDTVVPEHRGRPQLAGDELSPADQRAHHPAAAVVHGDVRPADGTARRSRGHQRRSPVLRDAWQRRERGQACGVRRGLHEGTLECSAARAVPDGRAVNRR